MLPTHLIKKTEFYLNEKKLLRLDLENKIKELYINGCIFFSITLNLTDKNIIYDINDSNFYIEIKNKIDHIKDLLSTLELWEIIIITTESTKKNKVHFHILLGIYSFLGNNKSFCYILNNILFINNYKDVVINNLDSQKSLNNYITYLCKNNDIYLKNNKHLDRIIFYIFIDSLRSQFYSQLADSFDMYQSNLTINGISENINNKYLIEFNSLTSTYTYNDVKNFIPYYSFLKQSIDTETYINIVIVFFVILKIKINDNNAYLKKKEFNLTYELFLENINNIDKHINNIYQTLLVWFPNHFKYFDFYTLQIKYIKENSKLWDILFKFDEFKLKLDYNLIEFKDGIFFLNENKFFNKESVRYNKLIFENNTGTLKYKHILYRNLKTPDVWIYAIKHAIGDLVLYDTFIKNLYFIITKNNIAITKKKVLYVYGESNSLKTTLVSKPLFDFFGENKIGLIVESSKNFKYQEMINKEIAILDEYKYNSHEKKYLLKFFEGQPMKIDQKFQKPEMLNIIPIVIISNEKIIEKDTEILVALQNRINEIKFKPVSTYKLNIEKNYLNLIKNLTTENIEIIIYIIKETNYILKKETQLAKKC